MNEAQESRHCTGLGETGSRGGSGELTVGVGSRALLAAARLTGPWLRDLVDSTCARIDPRTVLATCPGQDVPASPGRREHKAPCPPPPASPPQWVLKWLCGRERAPSKGPRSTGAVEVTGVPRLERRGHNRSESGVGEQLQNMLRKMLVNFSVTGDRLRNVGRGVVISIVLSTVTNKHATS